MALFSAKGASRHFRYEYLYGKNPVHLALLARARQCRRLFVQHDRRRQMPMEPRLQKCIELAQDLGVSVCEHGNLDMLCPDKPHQNIVLEARPLAFREASGLADIAAWAESPSIRLVGYGKNETTALPRLFRLSRHEEQAASPEPPPVCVFLDGVLDPQNLGAMIRSACYFGADALVLEERGSSPASSPAVSKASAGALELYGGSQERIIYTRSASAFLKQSLENGWQLVGTLPPSPELASSSTGNAVPTLEYRAFSLNRPTILLLGSEGQGIRQTLLKLCQAFLSISSARSHGTEMLAELDSLNVSVSLGILLAHIMRRAAS